MTRLNPIIKRDLEIKGRSFYLSLGMGGMNAVLFLVALAGSFSLIIEGRESLSLDYRGFLRIYALTATLFYLMLLFCAPLFTAGAISGEREKGTFDLLLTTRLSPADIIIEKLVSALISVAMLTVSGLPALLVPLIFGGVRFQSVVYLELIMITELFFILCIGMFSSTLARTQIRSLAAALALTFAAVAGPVLTAVCMRLFTGAGQNYSAYLLILDPLFPVLAVISRQLSRGELLGEIFSVLGARPQAAFLRYFPAIGIAAQLAVSFGLIVISVMRIMVPGSNKRRGARGGDPENA